MVFSLALPTEAAPAAGTQSPAERTAAAKKEGAVNFYSTWDIARSSALEQLFQKHYPGIQVNVFRANAASMNNRLALEAKTGRHEFGRAAGPAAADSRAETISRQAGARRRNQ
jgi:hypothetical protein